MKRMALPAILVAAVLAFALAGCSGAQSMSDDTLKGTWKLESGESLGFDAYVSFEDDNVAEVLLADSWLTGTWSVSGTEGSIKYDNGVELEGDDASASAAKSAKLTYSNNKLTMGSPDGSKLVFVKDDSEETKQMFALDMSTNATEGMGDEGVEYTEPVVEAVEPVAVADDDKFTITVTGKGTDFTGDPGYQLSITNKTDKSVYLMPEGEFTVGDKKAEPGLGEEVEAGATIESFMYFSQDELGGALEALVGADGVIQVLDYDSDDVVASYTFHM